LTTTPVTSALTSPYSASPSTTAKKPGGKVTKATVSIGSTSLGKVLVDGSGKTLYTLAGDTTTGKSACTGACATIWPPLVVTTTATYGPGLNASKFTTITRADGNKQLTYNGKPLYTFASDAVPGDVRGQGVGGFHVATAG
jgi:predicted lipoprotein with Yx(FWY)xxD motif